MSGQPRKEWASNWTFVVLALIIGVLALQSNSRQTSNETRLSPFANSIPRQIENSTTKQITDIRNFRASFSESLPENQMGSTAANPERISFQRAIVEPPFAAPASSSKQSIPQDLQATQYTSEILNSMDPLNGPFVEKIQSAALLNRPNSMPLTLNDLICRALTRSSLAATAKIRALEEHQTPGEALGEFDLEAFVNGRFSDNDVLAQNQSGANSQIEAGVAKQFGVGSQFEFAQKEGLGSAVPGSVLAFNFSQQILDGGGRLASNNVLLARLNAEKQSAEAVAELTQLVVDVTSAYWQLFQFRGEYLVRQEQMMFAQALSTTLQQRRKFDANIQQNSLDLANQTFYQRQGQLAVARTAILDTQNELCRLINVSPDQLEIIPTEAVNSPDQDFDTAAIIETAYFNRPEISQAVRNIRESELNLLVATNKTLPELELFIESLKTTGNSVVANQDDISYATGFNFSQPLLNRTGRFQKRRTELELARRKEEILTQAQQVAFDVRQAINGIQLQETQLAAETQQWKFATSRTMFLKRRIRNPQSRKNKSIGNIGATIFQLFEAQDDQGDSLVNIAKQIGDLSLQQINLESAKGTLVTETDLNNGSVLRRNQMRRMIQFLVQAAPETRQYFRESRRCIDEKMHGDYSVGYRFDDGMTHLIEGPITHSRASRLATRKHRRHPAHYPLDESRQFQFVDDNKE